MWLADHCPIDLDSTSIRVPLSVDRSRDPLFDREAGKNWTEMAVILARRGGKDAMSFAFSSASHSVWLCFSEKVTFPEWLTGVLLIVGFAGLKQWGQAAIGTIGMSTLCNNCR